MQTLYENKHYRVVKLDEPVFDKDKDMPPLSYGVFNIETDVVETYSTFYPGAIQTADGLSEKMDEYLPTPPALIQLPKVAIP